METVGKYLKRERELRNISLKEISTATKIRENILKAIEEDRHDLLTTPVFVKGFLVAYVKYVGLDPSDVLLRYESDLKELHGPEEKGLPGEQQKAWNRRFLLGTVIVIVGIGFILLNPWRKPGDRKEQVPLLVVEAPVVQKESPPPPTVPVQDKVAPPADETIVVEKIPPADETIVVERIPPAEETIVIREIPPAQETIVMRETPPDETPTETASETLLAERTSEPEEMARRELTLQIRALEETWIAFQVDAHLPREVTLRAGETFSQHANGQIKLKIGNAGGVNVTFNGKDLGSLGDSGRVVRLSLTQKGYEFKERDDFQMPGYGDEVKPTDSD
jgi:cytoskeleton protein RodZ